MLFTDFCKSVIGETPAVKFISYYGSINVKKNHICICN